MSIEKIMAWAGMGKKPVAGGTVSEGTAMEPITLTKKIGDLIQLSVDMENMQLSNYVGFRLVFPHAIMRPAIMAGSDAAVDRVDGDVFAGREVDLQCNHLIDDNTGEHFVYVSKAIKTGSAMKQDGRVVTLKFLVQAAGSGEIRVEDRAYGLMEDGQDTAYESDCDPVMLTLEEYVSPPVAVFRIVVE